MATTIYTPSMLRGAGTRGVPEVSAGSSFENTYSMAFDGVDDIFEVVNNSNLQFGKTDAYSVSFWIHTTTHILNSKKILGTGTYWATAAYASTGYSSSPARYGVTWRMGGTWPTSAGYYIAVGTGNVLEANTWYNIIITYDGSENGSGMKIYQTGSLANTATVNWGSNSQNSLNASTFKISRTSTAMLGNLDEIAVWRSELTSTHVGEIYNSGTPPDLNNLSTTPKPSSWFRMGENATWDGTDWTLENQGSLGIDAVSDNMDEEDREEEVPS